MFNKPIKKPNYYDMYFRNKLIKTQEIKPANGSGAPPLIESKITVKEPKKPIPGSKLVAEFKKLHLKP